MKLPVEIYEVIKYIRDFDKQAYLVGGAVRNYLLDIKINDYDITTDAKPEEILQIFKEYKTIDIGKNFGTILVIYKGYNVEITTFRKDGKYKDGRRPEKVEFSKKLEADLVRRDFTINAMAYDLENIIDLFDAKKDLENKIIRTVNNPIQRFSEDYLRILRAIRFASELQFTIEKETLDACIYYNNKLELVSVERIRDEFFKILLSEKPSIGMEYMRKIGVLKILFPEIYSMVNFEQNSKHHDFDLYNHTLKVIDNTRVDLELRLAGLFHDLGKLFTKTIDKDNEAHYYNHARVSEVIGIQILNRLNCPKKLIKNVSILIKYHMINNIEFKEKGIKRLINKFSDIDIFKLFELQKADRASMKMESIDISDIIDMEEKVIDILNTTVVYHQKQLAINGNDVIELGYRKGKIIGEILSYALDLVMEKESLNDKTILLKLIEEQYKDRREE